MSVTTFSTKQDRIESIDILRGFTLFGIIIVHMVEQYYAGQWPEQFQNATAPTMADQIVLGLISILISGKFYMIFSFLFGLSFFIQFSKSDSDKNFLPRFTWRLIILFIIGAIHHLHYRGDILGIYAVLGFGLLIFHRLPDKYLLWLSIFLILNIPSAIIKVAQMFQANPYNPFNADQPALLAYYNALKSGTYFDILKANYYQFEFKMMFQVFSGRLFITLGLFLLGIYAGRKRFFENAAESIPLLKKLRFRSWMTLLGCVVFSLIVFGGTQLLKMPLPDNVTFLIGGFIYDLFNAALAVIYVMWILLWLQKDKWKVHLQNLYPVGRMGLTVYLMQTLFGTLIFFSYGLGLLGEFGAVICFVIAIFLFVVQIIFAKYWFKYFNYGPVEWIWRNLTYLRIFPLKKSEAITVVQ